MVEQKLNTLKENGVYITGYKDLDVKKDDGWISGKANITLSENGTEADYSVFIIFGGSRLNPQIGRIESLDQHAY